MAKVLIGYATRTGAASDIAETLAAELRASGDEVRLACLKDEDPQVDGVDLVVVGSGIHAGAWYPEASAWLTRHLEALQGARVAVFNTCLNAADSDKREEARGYNQDAIEKVGAIAGESFAGRYEKKRVGLFQRLLFTMMRQPERDLVDRDAARTWARELLALTR